MGISFAILAAVTWALGDFSIEHSSRRIGMLSILFYISLFAGIVYLPWVYKSFALIGAHLGIFLLAAGIFLFGSITDFLALKTGKISVIEPICAFEVPVTALAAYLLIGERVSEYQAALIAFMVLGIFLVSVRHFSHLKHAHTEKGAWYALLATVGMGFANYFFAEAGRLTSPWLINWFGAVFVLAFISVYIFSRRELRSNLSKIRGARLSTTSAMVMDNFSWIFYTYAALYIPISIAVSISESYIALAALLGLIINKEKLRAHQMAGMIICIVAVILLSLTLS